MACSGSQSDSIAAYARDRSPELHAICDKLKREIERVAQRHLEALARKSRVVDRREPGRRL
jgi:hypothetical protein